PVFVGRGGIERLDVQVLNISAIVGETPSDAFVVADDDERRARQGESFDVPARRREVNFIPNRRDGEFEMRVVGQERLSGRGVSSADNPVVAAKAMKNLAAGIFDRVAQGWPERGGKAHKR